MGLYGDNTGERYTARSSVTASSGRSYGTPAPGSRFIYFPLVWQGWSGPQPLPDLAVGYAYLNMRGYNGGCVTKYDDLVMMACIRNQGLGDAGPFRIAVDGLDGGRFPGIEKGGRVCLETIPWGGGFAPVEVVVDSAGEVAESDEDNNVWEGMIPVPTPPILCTATPTRGVLPPPGR